MKITYLKTIVIELDQFCQSKIVFERNYPSDGLEDIKEDLIPYSDNCYISHTYELQI